MRAVVLLLACVVATACTTAVSGTPSAPTGVLLPPRPREVRLDGVDPCSLLTADQRAELGLTSEPRASKPYVGLFRGDVPTCTMNGPYPQTALVAIGLVTTVGVDRWSEADVDADVRPTNVADFPALVVVPRRFTDYCSVEVDIASGQLVEVQYGVGGTAAARSRDELCSLAERIAGETMATLLKL